jgi:UDP-glucuronate 4-epimerase
MESNDKRVLVTGAAGFIGAHVARHLSAQGWEVSGLDLRAGEGIIGCDLRSDDLPEETFPHIVHLAALGGVRPSMDRPLDYMHTNVSATLRLLEHAVKKGTRRVVFASSSSVYGPTEGRPSREDDVLNPCSPYALTKIQGEEWGRLFAEKHGIDFIALRLFAVWGEGQRPDLALESFRRKIAAGETVQIHGDGRQRRDFTHVSDVVRAIEAALAWQGRSFEVFNVGAGVNHSVNDVLRKAERLAGKRAEVAYGPEHAADVPVTLADVAKAKDLLSWEARVSFPDSAP